MWVHIVLRKRIFFTWVWNKTRAPRELGDMACLSLCRSTELIGKMESALTLSASVIELQKLRHFAEAHSHSWASSGLPAMMGRGAQVNLLSVFTEFLVRCWDRLVAGWGHCRGLMKLNVLVTQSCLTLCEPMDCCPPGSSVHGILQARILAWVAIFFSRGSFPPRDSTWVCHITGRFFTVWATSGCITGSLWELYAGLPCAHLSTWGRQPHAQWQNASHAHPCVLP